MMTSPRMCCMESMKAVETTKMCLWPVLFRQRTPTVNCLGSNCKHLEDKRRTPRRQEEETRSAPQGQETETRRTRGRRRTRGGRKTRGGQKEDTGLASTARGQQQNNSQEEKKRAPRRQEKKNKRTRGGHQEAPASATASARRTRRGHKVGQRGQRTTAGQSQAPGGQE